MFSIRCNSRIIKSWINQKNLQRIKKNKLIINEPKPIINEYNWGVIHFPSEKDDRKKFEKNNVTITLNVLYAE